MKRLSLFCIFGVFAISGPSALADSTLDPSLIQKIFYVMRETSVIPTNGQQAMVADPKCNLELGGQMEILGESSDHSKVALRYHTNSSNNKNACAPDTLAFIDKAAFFEQLSLLDMFKLQCHQAYAHDTAQVNAVSPQVASLNTDMQKILQSLGQSGSVVDPNKPRKTFVPDDCDTLAPNPKVGQRQHGPAQSISLVTQKGIQMTGFLDGLAPGKVAPLSIPDAPAN
jgi:hypothetical protein